MAINHATVRADVWTTINGLLRTITGKVVVKEFPEDHASITKSDFPIIVQSPAEVSEWMKKHGKTNNPKEINVFVGVYALDPTNIDVLSDSIADYFELNNVAGVNSPIINDSSVDTLQAGGFNISFRIINLSFKMV